MNYIKYLRLTKGLTQTQLAHLAQTSQPAVAQYESGAKSPNLSTISKFAESIGQMVALELVPRMTREEIRSLAYHEAIAELIWKDDTIVDRAKMNLEKLIHLHPNAFSLLRRWKTWLNLSTTELIAQLLSQQPLAREMRQVSPFAGVLSAQKRKQILIKMRKSNDTRPI